MAILSRDAILAAEDLQTKTISVSEWGGDMKIRALTMAQLYDIKTLAGSNLLRGTILAFVRGVAEPAFTDADYELLRGKSAAVEHVVQKIFQLSGMGADALDDALKNSAPTQIDNSSIN